MLEAGQSDFPRFPRPKGIRDRLSTTEINPHDSVRHGYFKSFDGTKLFYSMEGKGKPLVFCYGLVCSSLHWTYQIEYFQKQYQTIWFDYRGHQNSELPNDLSSITVQNIATDLGCLLDELKIDDAVIIGHSMGVNVALDFCRQFPDRASALVLANGTARRPLEKLFFTNVSEAFFAGLRALHRLSPRLLKQLWKLQGRNPLTYAIVSNGGFNPHLTPREDIELYIEQVASMDPDVFVALIEDYGRFDATPWLHQVLAPSLILGGDLDLMIPVPEQELLEQLIPNARLEVIHHGSHCAQMDLPEVVNLKIERFLGEIGYGAK